MEIAAAHFDADFDDFCRNTPVAGEGCMRVRERVRERVRVCVRVCVRVRVRARACAGEGRMAGDMRVCTCILRGFA